MTAEELRDLMLADADWRPYHCVECMDDFPADLLEWCQRILAAARGDSKANRTPEPSHSDDSRGNGGLA